MPPESASTQGVGERSSAYRETITPELLRAFSQAVGSTSPVPPTILTRYRLGEFELFQRLGIPLASVLHAEQGYRYRPEAGLSFLIPGDELHYETVVSLVVDKKSGSGMLRFLTLDTEFQRERAGQRQMIGSSRTTVAVRSQAAQSAGDS